MRIADAKICANAYVWTVKAVQGVIMKGSITIPTGKVIGIGKLKVFATDAFPHEIPTLSFLVSRAEGGMFVSTCIQLMLDSEGETPNQACDRLKNLVLHHLNTLFEKCKENSWESLHKSFNDNFSAPYWDAYRDFQLNLAEQGISTDTKTALYKRITELEGQINDLRAMIDNSNKSLSAKIVDYQEELAA